MADKKKKVDILPGKSPWERKAIKSGKTMTPMQVEMHKAFIAGKSEAKKMAQSGNYKTFSNQTVKKVRATTTKAGAQKKLQNERKADYKKWNTKINIGSSGFKVGTPNLAAPFQVNWTTPSVKEQRLAAAKGLGKVTKANKIYKKKYSAK